VGSKIEKLFSGEETAGFDRLIAAVGYHPDRNIHAELQVDECPAFGGPAKLAADLLHQQAHDDLAESFPSPLSLVAIEPNLYCLGSKSFGGRSNFLMDYGLRQIRDLYSLIGER
jgi:hypothetical protein